MTKPALTVTISGPPKSGKTNLALTIQAALYEAGYDPLNIDDVVLEQHSVGHKDTTVAIYTSTVKKRDSNARRK